MKRGSKKQGMTLVELLIVMIIIGILASMLILTCIESTPRAHATRIVSDLESLREGCIIHYSHTETWPDSFSDISNNVQSGLTPDALNSKGFSVFNSGDFGCVMFDIAKTSSRVRSSMGRLSNESGLFFTPSSSDLDSRDDISLYDGSSETGFIVKLFRCSNHAD